LDLCSAESGNTACTRHPLATGRVSVAAQIKLDFSRKFDDGFGMTGVLRQRVFDSLGAADEEAALESILFLGDPLAVSVAADEDDV
jgi:hypothetical protein